MNIGALWELVNVLLFGRYVPVAENNEASGISGANRSISGSRSLKIDACTRNQNVSVLGFVAKNTQPCLYVAGFV
jgi:hypothetical protein